MHYWGTPGELMKFKECFKEIKGGFLVFNDDSWYCRELQRVSLVFWGVKTLLGTNLGFEEYFRWIQETPGPHLKTSKIFLSPPITHFKAYEILRPQESLKRL